LQDDCLSRAGLINALAALSVSGVPSLTTELLLLAAPDVIFVADPALTPRPFSPEALPSGYPWQLLDAVRARRVHAIPSAWMSSISHHALKACEAYAALAEAAPL
jgi:ABC-type Fe3+-hydroxamate transport system substrate-binding protein